MSEGLGCSISEGTLVNWNRQASLGLQATMEKIKQGLIISRLLHSDETGIHIGLKLRWLHTVCTRFLTYLQWHRKRGREAIDEMGILPAFRGRLMRDRLSSYDHYDCESSVSVAPISNATVLVLPSKLDNSGLQEWRKRLRP
jgi:transposase